VCLHEYEKQDMNDNKLSNFDRVRNLIINATNKSKSIIIPLDLIAYAGETQKAVFLAWLIYLSDKGRKPNGFIWKSYPDWEKETGLSKAQVERIVKDFRDKRNIIETKKMLAASKNGNASNTWHYKLLMGNFLKDLDSFLLTRSEKDLGLEPEETDYSITDRHSDRHNIDTSNITLYENHIEGNLKPEEEEKQDSKKEIEDIDNLRDIGAESGIKDFDLDIIDGCSASASPSPASSLSEQFEPTLANKVWAAKTFPFKSQKLMTEKFIDFYKEKKHIHRDSDGWQKDWRKWVQRESPQRGIDSDIIENQAQEIENQLLNWVYDFVSRVSQGFFSKNISFHIVPPKVFKEYFCDENNFEWQYIEEALEYLVENNFLSKYFDCYYDLIKYKENPEWAKKVDGQMCFYSHDIPDCKRIFESIKTKSPVSQEDIIKEFPELSQDSIENLLRVTNGNRLNLIEGKYHFVEEE